MRQRCSQPTYRCSRSRVAVLLFVSAAVLQTTGNLYAAEPSKTRLVSLLNKPSCDDLADAPDKIGINEIRTNEIGTIYRRTKNGWEDSSKWRFEIHSGASTVSSAIRKIHPAIWGFAILGVVMMVLVAAHDEDEIESLFQDFDRYLRGQ